MGEIDAFAATVAAHLPAVIHRIPPTPAAELGRLEPEPEPTTVVEALRSLGPLLAERLLGALELHLDDLPTHAHGLALAPMPAGGAFALLSGGVDSETYPAVAMLDATRPGLTDLIADLVTRLTHHPTLAEHLTTPPARTAPAGTAPAGTAPTAVPPTAAPPGGTASAAGTSPAGAPAADAPLVKTSAADISPTRQPQAYLRPVLPTPPQASAEFARYSLANPAARPVPPTVRTDDATTRAAYENLLRHSRRQATRPAPQAAVRVTPVRRPPRLPIPNNTPEARAENTAAAHHAAPHLALALITTHAVLKELDAATPAAVVGTALGITARHLPTLPKPAAYTEAAQARRRAEYVLPAISSGQAEVRAHHFTLTEAEAGEEAGEEIPDFSANGLVTVTRNGIAVRTATEDHWVPVQLSVLTAPPDDEDPAWWDEVVEISWHAHRGGARIPGHVRAHQTGTPPWPGDFRVRVHARGRDGNDEERYHLAVWAAPPAPEHVIKRLDPAEPPYAAHRWVARSSLSEAATVTVITGSTLDRVLAGFGATEPASLRSLAHDLEPWVAVREVDGAIIAVEHNGHQGADDTTLAALSETGRAASMFWTVDALTKLSFAEHGRLVTAFEPWAMHHVPDPIAELLDGLPGTRHKIARGLTAVARFTGRGITPEDLRAIEEADVAHRIRR